MSQIMIIDDDRMVCDIIASFIQAMGHAVDQRYSLAKGLAMIAEGSFDLILLDVRLPDGNGLDRIPQIRGATSAPEVIIITGEGSADGAKLAMENGAWDYLQKPLSTEKVRLSISRALQYHQERISSSFRGLLKRDDIIGKSQAIRSCLEQVARNSQSNASVLITGDSGTGKELFARAKGIAAG